MPPQTGTHQAGRQRILFFIIAAITVHTIIIIFFGLTRFKSVVSLPEADDMLVAVHAKKNDDNIMIASIAAEQIISSESLPIYLIDTSNAINQTNIAASTWGDIASNWNQTTQYSDLVNVATSVPSLPNQYDSYINGEKRRPIVIIHTAPKLGSTTLRKACKKNLMETCPEMLQQLIANQRKNFPLGYFGGPRLVEAMNKCVDTHYFCVHHLKAWELPSTISDGESDMLLANKTTADKSVMQNVDYIHLFPFRNYNDWVKSAIKQQYDVQGESKCRRAKMSWDNGKCKHFHPYEIDIRRYPRVDLDRFQDGVVRRMKGYYDDKNESSSYSGNSNLEEEGRETHTFVLYLHRDMERTMKKISEGYNLPMLPGTTARLNGGRPEGTCDESVEKLYHACFSDQLMNFRWDLPENHFVRCGDDEGYDCKHKSSRKRRKGGALIRSITASASSTHEATDTFPQPKAEETDERCTFCERGMLQPCLVVPAADGNTCQSIQSMADRYSMSSDVCAIIKKQEMVCCPENDDSKKYDGGELQLASAVLDSNRSIVNCDDIGMGAEAA